MLRLRLYGSERHRHGDEQAPQLQAVSTTAVGLGGELAQQVSLEHKRIEDIRGSSSVVHGSSKSYGLQARSRKIS